MIIFHSKKANRRRWISIILKRRKSRKFFIATSNHAAVEAIDFPGMEWKAAPLSEDPDIYAVTDRHVSKAQGIWAPVQISETELSEVVAFGDDYNDLEMIREAGQGCRDSQRRTEISAAADQRTKATMKTASRTGAEGALSRTLGSPLFKVDAAKS